VKKIRGTETPLIPRKGETVPEIWTEGRGWIAGPWTIEIVVGAYSGPSYVFAVVNGAGERDVGKVFYSWE
jgi:hypothetical protein